MQDLVQQGLSSDIEPPTITIAQAASRLSVSTATIRNWIKADYLIQCGKGKITLASLAKFELQVLGKDKLTHRANKSLKDAHDHDKIVARFTDNINASGAVSDKTGTDYEASLSDAYRNKEGIYYTPNAVVRDLFTVSKARIKDALFCDPCCGSGNFIIRAIALGFKPQHIYGYDVDPVAVALTKTRIARLTGYKSDNIKVANFLDIATDPEPPQFDYIYTNPPWGKKLTKRKRQLIGLKLSAGSSIDTCSLFFFACLTCLKDKGSLGLLLPDSFFNIAVFEDARIKVLTLSIVRLIDYGKVFKGLVTNAEGLVLKKRTPNPTKPISCQINGISYTRSRASFSCNPKSILNFYCDDKSAEILAHLMALPHITLKNQASWALGIVTGNNKKFIASTPKSGHIPVYKGADILQGKLKPATSFIPSDMGLYQQVAPIALYKAKEKLAYKFIAAKLCFFYDEKQRFFLNSANMLIPDNSFPLSTKVLGALLSSGFMNWLFARLFRTHKILRGDIESLPIHSQFLKGVTGFDEASYLKQLGIERKDNGTYGVKR